MCKREKKRVKGRRAGWGEERGAGAVGTALCGWRRTAAANVCDFTPTDMDDESMFAKEEDKSQPTCRVGAWSELASRGEKSKVIRLGVGEEKKGREVGLMSLEHEV